MWIPDIDFHLRPFVDDVLRTRSDSDYTEDLPTEKGCRLVGNKLSHRRRPHKIVSFDSIMCRKRSGNDCCLFGLEIKIIASNEMSGKRKRLRESFEENIKERKNGKKAGTPQVWALKFDVCGLREVRLEKSVHFSRPCSWPEILSAALVPSPNWPTSMCNVQMALRRTSQLNVKGKD